MPSKELTRSLGKCLRRSVCAIGPCQRLASHNGNSLSMPIVYSKPIGAAAFAPNYRLRAIHSERRISQIDIAVSSSASLPTLAPKLITIIIRAYHLWVDCWFGCSIHMSRWLVSSGIDFNYYYDWIIWKLAFGQRVFFFVACQSKHERQKKWIESVNLYCAY